MNKIFRAVIVVGLAVSLVACQSVKEGMNEPETPQEEETSGGETVAEEEPIVDEEQEEPVETPLDEEQPAHKDTPDSIELADEKEIDVFVEGETEKRTAIFHRAPLGYGIYILEGYTLVSEEPNRDVIFSNADEEFFIRITSHGKNADVEAMKKTIVNHANGTIHEDTDIPLKGVEFAILEEFEMNGLRQSVIHTAKKYEEDVLSFTIYLPLKEAAEGIGPNFWAMLETIEY